MAEGFAIRQEQAAPDRTECVTVETVREVRARVSEARRAGATVALVPTMGALHEGHLSLIRQAAAECDLVVVSVFVNPRQFDDPADLARYPRDPAADAALAGEAGASLVFAPDVAELYPAGYATSVHVGGPAEGLEGSRRGPAHFDGVATVVTKLINIVAPDVVCFGRKDAQQVAVVRRVLADLDLPVRIAEGETVREPTGLALSSRNALLRPEDRTRATALHEALAAAHAQWCAGERSAGPLIDRVRQVLAGRGVTADYVAVADGESFAPVTGRVTAPAVLALAARVGGVRLIDNLRIDPGADRATVA